MSSLLFVEESEGNLSSVKWFIGGGTIITSESVICGSEFASGWNEVSGGARLGGTFGILTRIARAIFDRLDNTPLAVSTLRCFILRSPF